MKVFAKSVLLASMAAAAMSVHAADGKAVYEKSCKLCHASGMAGAPKVGDKAGWAARIAKGMSVLEGNAINGFKDKGFMPPRGGNSKLSDMEVKAAVAYMVEGSK